MHKFRTKFFAILPPGAKSTIFLEVFLRLRTNMQLIWDESALKRNSQIIIMEFLQSLDFPEIVRRINYTKNNFPRHSYILFGPKLFQEQTRQVQKLGVDQYYDYYTDLNQVVSFCQNIHKKEPKVVQYGDLELNQKSKSVSLAGTKVNLRKKEFELLAYLLKQPETAISSVELLENIWGYSMYVVTNTLRSHVSSIRSKFKKLTSVKYIQTLPKQGYILSAA